MSLRLKVEHGQDAGRVWRLKDPGAYVIGRDATSAIRVLDMKVSKGHCEIHVLNGNEGGARIKDLKSTHGTQLNGQPLARETALKPGDEIRLGFTVLRLLSDGPADAVAAPSGPLPKPEAEAAAVAGAPAAGAAPAAAAGPNVTAPWAKDSLASSGSTSASAVQEPKSLPPDELVGKTLAGYRVIRKIGQGGMGSVYMAEQVSLKREVALKVLSEKFVADSAFVDQFLNEARAAGQLNHPNVVQVYDVGQADGRYFFSMEYVPGGATEDKVKGGTSAEWPDALNWLIDAANALIFAQKRGILHRDVKPDNLMLAEDGSAKLCDLGLAKKSESQDLLAQGIIGTPHFLSPEAIRRKPDIDHRTDLYSLGCTFYRILSGENPYPAKTVKDILLGHLNKPVPRVTDKKPDVPKDLSDAIYKLMQKEPAQRYQSADELYDSLDKIRIQHGLAAHGIKQGGKKPLIIAAIVALLAAGVVAWVLTRPDPPRVKTEAEILQEQLDAKNRKDLEDQKRALERTSFLSESDKNVSFLENEALRKDVEKTWGDEAFWSDFLKRLDTLHAELAGHAVYGADEDLKPILERIKKLQEDITTKRKFNREYAQTIEQKRAELSKDLDDGLTGHLAKYDAAMVVTEGQVFKWWDAAALVARGAVEEVLKPIRKRAAEFEVAGKKVELLKDKEIDARARKMFPGTDWDGQDLFNRALAEGDRLHKVTMQRIAEGARDPSPEKLRKVQREFETYRDALPEPDPAENEVNKALREQRKEAKDAAEKYGREAAELYEVTLAADRARFHQIVRFLREPDKGKMALFAFTRPLDEAQLRAGELVDPAYRRRGAELLADDAALTSLFANLRATFDTKGWASLEIEDEAGKLQKVTEVGPTGMTCPAKTTRAWVDFGARFLLERVFYVKPDQPRFPFSGLDHRGLAVLAEMAGHGPLADLHWKKFGETLTPADTEVQLGVSGRVTGLPREMQVAEKWKFIHDAARQIQELGAGIKEKGPLTPEQRERLLREERTVLQLLQDVAQTFLELDVNEELAATIWGTSIRDFVHPRAAYTGEVVPASVKAPEPIKIPEPTQPPAPGAAPAAGAPPGPGDAAPANPPGGGDKKAGAGDKPDVPKEPPASPPKAPGK